MNLMFNISYGLYLVCASANGKDNACISNTLMQATSTPERLTLTLNKANLTHDLIKESKKCAVAIISTDAPFDVFKDYGMRSGRDCDKMLGRFCETASNGVKVPTDYTLGYFEFDVVESIDFGTHTMFVLEPTAQKVVADGTPVTYAYYQSNIKPKPQPKPQEQKEEVWVCRICGYVHHGPLPADFVCPICKHPASDFEKQ